MKDPVKQKKSVATLPCEI